MGLTRRDVLHVSKGRQQGDVEPLLGSAPLAEGDVVDLRDYVDAYDLEVYEAPTASDLPSASFALGDLGLDVPDAVRVLSVTPEDGQYRVVTTGPQPGLRVQFYLPPED